MKINGSNRYANAYEFNQTDYADKGIAVKKKDITVNGNIDEDKKMSDIEAFQDLCKKFPNVSFVVVDEIGGPLSEYSGICRTSTFGDLNQVSIKIEEEVIKNLEKDYENIARMIQSISDCYEFETKQAARATGADYAAVELHYKNAKTLSYGRIYYFQDPPILCREQTKNEEEDMNLGINEKALQAFLMNIQKELSDKMLEIGEKEQRHKSAQEGSRIYQGHFIYAKEEFENES